MRLPARTGLASTLSGMRGTERNRSTVRRQQASSGSVARACSARARRQATDKPPVQHRAPRARREGRGHQCVAVGAEESLRRHAGALRRLAFANHRVSQRSLPALPCRRPLCCCQRGGERCPRACPLSGTGGGARLDLRGEVRLGELVLRREVAPAARPGRGRRDQAGRDGERERHVQARSERPGDQASTGKGRHGPSSILEPYSKMGGWLHGHHDDHRRGPGGTVPGRAARGKG